MRFIGPYAAQQVVAIPQKTEQLANGSWRVIDAGYVAHFRNGDFTDYERDVAYQVFGSKIKKGSQFTDETHTQHAPTEWRIGTFDSAVIDDAGLRKQVEQALLKHREYGHDFLAVEKPKPKPPWPRYDDLVPQGQRTIAHIARQIAETVVSLGLDPAEVLAYEHGNRDRAEVVEALETLAPQAEEEIVVPA